MKMIRAIPPKKPPSLVNCPQSAPSRASWRLESSALVSYRRLTAPLDHKLCLVSTTCKHLSTGRKRQVCRVVATVEAEPTEDGCESLKSMHSIRPEPPRHCRHGLLSLLFGSTGLRTWDLFYSSSFLGVLVFLLSAATIR
ncbi:hypothetical protein BJX68DRAFT_58817 [Aspergillus pseudodeflectus]|uniref:Uncharacterized protein n=1 Tax=Aspergillus pseudodeflectus TaxID=176178 RepID=A0ABR4KLV0_9EURO